MGDKAWKAFERTVSGVWYTVRNPLSSRWSRHDTESDTLDRFLYLEAKRDAGMFTKKLREVLATTLLKAKKEGKLPVLCLKEHGKQGFWLMVHSSHFEAVSREYLGRVVAQGEAE